MTDIEDELADLFIDTLDAWIEYGSPVVDTEAAVAAILARWVLIPRIVVSTEQS
jgi:hypothetical protein